MILTIISIVLGVLVVLGALVVIVAYNCFDDDDDDMYWHDSQR